MGLGEGGGRMKLMKIVILTCKMIGLVKRGGH